MLNITEIRRKNVEIARKSSNETNNLKGIRKYVLGKTKKQKLQNEIIDELIKNGYYKMIWNKWVDYAGEIYDYMGCKDMKILELFKFTEPDDLKDFKDGLIIIEKEL
jgi:hypothetical protein